MESSNWVIPGQTQRTDGKQEKAVDGTSAPVVSFTVPETDVVDCAWAAAAGKSGAATPSTRHGIVFIDRIDDSRKYSFLSIDKMCLQKFPTSHNTSTVTQKRGAAVSHPS
jgi:hypothetical protein